MNESDTMELFSIVQLVDLLRLKPVKIRMIGHVKALFKCSLFLPQLLENNSEHPFPVELTAILELFIETNTTTKNEGILEPTSTHTVPH